MVEYYNQDNKNEDKSYHCGLGTSTHTPAAREVQDHAECSQSGMLVRKNELY